VIECGQSPSPPVSVRVGSFSFRLHSTAARVCPMAIWQIRQGANGRSNHRPSKDSRISGGWMQRGSGRRAEELSSLQPARQGRRRAPISTDHQKCQVGTFEVGLSGPHFVDARSATPVVYQTKSIYRKQSKRRYRSLPALSATAFPSPRQLHTAPGGRKIGDQWPMSHARVSCGSEPVRRPLTETNICECVLLIFSGL
jgi:hypothetical protein